MKFSEFSTSFPTCHTSNKFVDIYTIEQYSFRGEVGDPMGDQDKAPESGDWDPAKALEMLTMERALDSMESPQILAKRLLEECLPMATMSLCHIAVHGDSEVMRFQASKYVVERTMGPAERLPTVEGRNVWDEIYDKVTVEAEEYLNQ